MLCVGAANRKGPKGHPVASLRSNIDSRREAVGQPLAVPLRVASPSETPHCERPRTGSGPRRLIAWSGANARVLSPFSRGRRTGRGDGMSPDHLAPFSFSPSPRDDLPAPKTAGHSLRSCRNLLARSPALSGEILNRVQDDRREWGCFGLDLENGPVDGPDSHPRPARFPV
jgi:hypothetical protein